MKKKKQYQTKEYTKPRIIRVYEKLDLPPTSTVMKELSEQNSAT